MDVNYWIQIVISILTGVSILILLTLGLLLGFVLAWRSIDM